MAKKFLLVVVAVAAVVGVAAAVSPELRETLSARLASLNSSGSEHEGGEGHEGGHAHEGGEGHEEGGEEHAGHEFVHKIVVTSPVAKDVKLTQQFVCQIHSRRHIDVKALEGGYLESINVKEGQTVNKGDVMFEIVPILYSSKLDADLAEAQLAKVEYDTTKQLVDRQVVSAQEGKMARARLQRALAKVKMAKAEMDFATIRAPFDGIVDRLHEQEGSLIDEGAELTTMSDNHVMWVYFNVPESRYIEYQRALKSGEDEILDIELKLANQEIFDQPGQNLTIEADFDNEFGTIPFRADFENPDRLLRHGQTGNILIHRMEKDAIVIPQRATYEILAKKYAYVVDDEGTVRQREIHIKNELDDIFVIDKGLEPGEKIIYEGIRQVRDGDKVKYEFAEPEELLAHLKNHAE